ncbi:MAG: nucleoside 2-deoxyribosyltransferase [Opitutaceae bacterium]
MAKKAPSFTVYLASELYALPHLLGNAYLAEAIYDKSHGKYLCLLPQDSEPDGPRPRAIRDRDIRALLGCDLALFTFDGAEIESATVVEFMLAKFADIPAVVLRSDLRAAGDGPSPWTLMASYFPRTVSVVVDGRTAYRSVTKRRGRRPLDPVTRLAGQHSSADAQRACEEVAGACVRGFERVQVLEPVMPRHLREAVYGWLPLVPGLRGKRKELRKEFERCLERKVEMGLL